MSAPKPPDSLRVYQASRCVTMRVPGDKGKNHFVEWTHDEFAWLRWIKHLYDQGDLSEFLGGTA